ncbi:MAG: TonB-dependent receptor [Methylobacteriaceae bacterium]|nr:TonB-dependent receptor [Methylobacteriaceae bacterium]
MRRVVVAVVATSVASGALAQGGRTERLQEIEIVADSPLAAPDTGAPRAKVAGAAHTVGAAAIEETHQSDAAAALARRTPGVSIVDVAGNPFQPEIEFRGFSASPVVGTPQGIAVYQNGVRINESWGDVVNWDLIPTVAIERATFLGANPIFGLNALGGALTLDMKNGFTWQGFELDARAGGPGRAQGSAQYGVKSGAWAGYFAIEGVRDPGVRYFSGSVVRRFYGDIGYRGDRAELHATVGLANNHFGASGPAPADLVARDPRAVYTTPQTTQNRLAQFALTGAFDLSDTWKINAHVYHRAFDQSHTDGNTSDFQSCAAATLCDDSGAATGIPDVLPGAPYGVINRTWTRSRTIGGGVQATNTDKILGHGNRLVFGLSYDRGWTDFKAHETIGVIQPNLVVTDLGIVVNEPANDVIPVSLRASNTHFGAYALDTFDVTDRLSVTFGGRFNQAKVALYDLRGVDLNGGGSYSRFNPTAGATFKITDNVSAYANYAEANRAPTPLELGCADPNRPCAIDSFLVSDPPLKQVVSRTIEAGFRGSFTLPQLASGKFEWSAGLYRTINSDDIMSVPSAVTGLGYFVNAGRTRRQGVETSLTYKDDRLSAYFNYTLTDAVFLDQVQLGSPNNPFAIASGQSAILVGPGSHLPAVPMHRIKAGADFAVTPEWKIGGDVVFASGSYLRGDEINVMGKLPAYALVNLRTSYQLTKQFQIYGLVENALNARPRTFGTLFDTTQIAFLPFANPRSVSVAPPFAAYVGAKYKF